jgi:hypothetical protein
MSKYKLVKVEFTDADALEEAMRSVAEFRNIVVDIDRKQTLALRAYGGGDTNERAMFRIRGNQFGSYYNEDFGLIQEADGTFRQISSTHDDGVLEPIRNELEIQYARHAALSEARARGLTVMSEIRDGDEYRIELAGTYFGN